MAANKSTLPSTRSRSSAECAETSAEQIGSRHRKRRAPWSSRVLRCMTTRKQFLGFLGWLVVAFAAAAVGAIASARAAEFYQALDRPMWAPPAAVFGPVWTFLYLCMAVASWLVWREPTLRRRP